MLTQGAVLHAGYRVLDKIAQGEIGEVYKAERVASGELCVLKVLNPELMADTLLVERFKAEAKRASTFRHPNVVRIEDAGEAEDGRPFVVMEYVPGENLRQMMAREGRLPVLRACFIARQVATALEAAHAWGIVHQHVTPGNIMVVEAPGGLQVNLLGCCIARIKEDRRRDVGGVALTRRGHLMGAPEYFSPEMASGRRGNELDGRSDIYSLGVVLYQMLSGELPFESKSATMGTLLEHLLVPPKSVSLCCPDLPGELGSLVMKMLEKKPESRPANARIVVEELESVESLLCQASAMAPGGPSLSQAREGVAEVVLFRTSTLPGVVPRPGRDEATLPPDSEAHELGPLVGIQFDTETSEAPGLPPQHPEVRPWPAVQKARRRWLRWAAGVAMAALSLAFAGWFLAPLRSKLIPHSEPSQSAPQRPFPGGTGGLGQTGQATGLPPHRPSAPPDTRLLGGTSSASEPTPQSAGARPGAHPSQDQNTPSRQAGAPDRLVSEQGAQHRPSANLATMRALTAEGDGFLRRGEYDRAIQSYSKALRLDPTSAGLRARIQRARTAKAAEEKYLNN
jgi:serine/threonine protein kinase